MKPYRYCADRKQWIFSNGLAGTYRHFYYFSTPLKRWLSVKRSLQRFGLTLPTPVEHRILRILDALIEHSGMRRRPAICPTCREPIAWHRDDCPEKDMP